MPKGFEHGNKVDAQSHNNSMLKQVLKNIMNIIKQIYAPLKHGNMQVLSTYKQNSRLLQVERANGKGIKHPSKIMPKSITKFMKERCRIYARKRDAKIMAKHTKMEPQWEPK